MYYQITRYLGVFHDWCCGAGGDHSTGPTGGGTLRIERNEDSSNKPGSGSNSGPRLVKYDIEQTQNEQPVPIKGIIVE